MSKTVSPAPKFEIVQRGALVAGFRFFIAFIMLGSLAWQITDRIAHSLFRPGEYYAYFTIDSSLIEAGVLAFAGWAALRGLPESKRLGVWRLCAVTFAVVVAIIYNAMLRGGAPDIRDAGYNWPVLPNELLHVWGPVLILIDWLLFSKQTRLPISKFGWVAAFPILWLAFSLTRGFTSGWFAYWFLDPAQVGASGMLIYILAITVFMLGVGIGMLSLLRVVNRKTS